LLGVLLGCAPVPVRPADPVRSADPAVASRPAGPGKCDRATYDAAVQKVQTGSFAPPAHTLWAISKSNPKLAWSPDGARVLMIQWTPWGGYPMGDTVMNRDVFLTPAPQLLELCRPLPPDARVERMQQYLGLPPEPPSAPARNVVEMWVSPADLFRPCPDPQIDDETCSVTFPPEVSAQHRDWMARYYGNAYAPWQHTRYPWTALGFTYDWCGGASPIGASEYILRAGSKVSIQSIIPTETYCDTPMVDRAAGSIQSSR
jgi:hypothetical protein